METEVKMLKEVIKITSLFFDITIDDIFFKALDVIDNSTLWPKIINYEKRSITVAGNIKVVRSDEIIKKTAMGSNLGLSILFPLIALSKVLYFDRLIIEFKKENDKGSTIFLYGRLNYGSIGSPIYYKAYTINYSHLLELLTNTPVPKDFAVIKEKINKKLNAKKIMMPSLLGLISIITIIIGTAYFLSGLLW